MRRFGNSLSQLALTAADGGGPPLSANADISPAVRGESALNEGVEKIVELKRYFYKKQVRQIFV